MSDEIVSQDSNPAGERVAAQAELDAYLVEIGAQIGCIRTVDGQPLTARELRAILRVLKG